MGIETAEIRMSSKLMLSVLLLNYGLPWVIAALVGFAVCIVLGCAVNIRFFLLALIWIFLLTPLVIAFLYFYYGMSPLTAFNSILHKLEFSDSEIEVKIIHLSENEEEISANEKEELLTTPEYSTKENSSSPSHSQENKTHPSKEYKVGIKDFHNIKSGKDYILLFFKEKGWLWVPVAGFYSIQDFKNIAQKFTSLRHAGG